MVFNIYLLIASIFKLSLVLILETLHGDADSSFVYTCCSDFLIWFARFIVVSCMPIKEIFLLEFCGKKSMIF